MASDLYKKAMDLPARPGVYQMLDKAGETIYVGKAKQLKNRVSSYFRGALDDKTAAMVSKVATFTVIVCASEFEALVLENSLIKERKPKYNILLKDDKGYPYVRLDKRVAYPRFTIVSKRFDDGAKYFGPYGGRAITRDAIRAVSTALRLPTCSRKFPQEIGRERPCLNHHMGACLAYCLPDTSKLEYDKALEQAILVLDGKGGDLIRTLTQEMEDTAEQMRFEQAAALRDKIRAIENLETRQNVITASRADTDIIGFARGATKSAFVILHYIGGKLLGKDVTLLDTPMEDDARALSAILRQHYEQTARYPKNIYLPCDLEDQGTLAVLFGEAAGFSVTLHTPKRGDKRQMIEVAAENASVEVERHGSKEEKIRGILTWLQKALDLPAPPMRVEAFDISNLGDSGIVAGMTVFQNAQPRKRDYRKFQIKSVTTQDDYHSMEEVLSRRFARYREGDVKFAPLPDLLLIDGGQTHVAVAERVMERFDLSIPAFGMVKDARHKTRALITAHGAEIGIQAVPQVFSFIATVQEETHRFALAYQKSLRGKTIGSSLDKIPGVGKTRRDAVLRAFKTVKQIRTKSVDELSAVVPRSAAEAIVSYFASENGGE